MTARTPLTALPAYSILVQLARDLETVSIPSLFDADPARAGKFSLQAAGLHLDFSKHRINAEALGKLVELAEQAQLSAGIETLLSGGEINTTEGRPALHTLLRGTGANALGDLYREVTATQARMRDVSERLNAGKHTGFSDEAITDVVNIGIGGSDLGPRLVTEALSPFHGAVRCHYVANVDPTDIAHTLRGLRADTTLFIICSKSFRTEETLANSLAARRWLLAAGATDTDLDRHFLAVTTNLAAAADFGISGDNCLPMWDWVGGRYSVWSAVGLSVAIAVGWRNFEDFLGGAAAMDAHFRDTPPGATLPVVMALLEVWYGAFYGAQNHVVLPYAEQLARLPDFLQQLTMESNGKAVDVNGEPLAYNTAPVLWGSAGTIGQHSFHQLLHQGTLLCPADFVLPLKTHTGEEEQHRRLVANCLAQSRAMLVGRSLADATASLTARGHSAAEAAELAPHLAMPGSRPNSVISMDRLTPATLGALLALYEHRTFVSGYLWGINPFDQWGVELGKEIGSQILARLEHDNGDSMDAATEALITRWREARD
ncbi:MAG: glucose-6-phosphate isomerase [Halioglobus sp.]|nr:glucose-6-phosphate isomerase [Halioglobus sp.]